MSEKILYVVFMIVRRMMRKMTKEVGIVVLMLQRFFLIKHPHFGRS